MGRSKDGGESKYVANKAHLLHLRLYVDSGDVGAQREIMNALKPHPGLECLEMEFNHDGGLSNWLLLLPLSSLHSLRVLTLTASRRYSRLEFLPPLGKLPFLESLDIKGFNRVEKVRVEFLGTKTMFVTASSSFPKLKQLTMSYMESWKEWGGVPEEVAENVTIMQCLSQLTIEGCQNLIVLPDFLWQTPLQNLKVKCSPFLEHLNANWQRFLKSKHS
ncbi:hypothetical protein ACLB2K_074582 [Fragaria x ananassa]